MNSWAGPSMSGGGDGGGVAAAASVRSSSLSNTTSPTTSRQQPFRFRAMVVDSGPIIKETNVPQWMGRADVFYTVPAVIQEIRDAKARHQLQQQWIPLLGLQVKEPSAESMQRMVEFSKLTGDYPSLSAVDLQVLALVLDLEREGCLSIEHLRTTPKRTVGLGTITSLASRPKESTSSDENKEGKEESSATAPAAVEDYDIVEESDDDDDDDCEDDDDDDEEKEGPTTSRPTTTISSWAALVNPQEGSKTVQVDIAPTATHVLSSGLASMTLISSSSNQAEALGGQWDDASEEEEKSNDNSPLSGTDLESEFPSLAAAATVPFEGEDDDDEDIAPTNGHNPSPSETTKTAAMTTTSRTVVFEDDTAVKERLEQERRDEEEERERRKQEALKPISKSGKMYNSFRKYGKLMKPAPPKLVPKSKTTTSTSNLAAVAGKDDVSEAAALIQQGQSRILGAGGSAMAGTTDDMKAEDDDGEGWITSPTDIRVLKNHTGGGPLDPIKGSAILTEDGATAGKATAVSKGPSNSVRAACTTTDFAMQNVLLQMGLVLMSVDGMQIRRLKSWVLRCGACFKIHTDPVDPKTGIRRMFCSHCGSDWMQRISASVDGKNGRLKLHFSKKRQNKHTSARGTKFSLPKAGTGNRFQGDLLLREDQLLMGAWNQKVKKNSGGQSRAHAQSIFGKDIASNVGCEATSMPNDIQVGFGRRNPNSAKGRERRGKKKKSDDRACGLRRY